MKYLILVALVVAVFVGCGGAVEATPVEAEVIDAGEADAGQVNQNVDDIWGDCKVYKSTWCDPWGRLFACIKRTDGTLQWLIVHYDCKGNPTDAGYTE